MKKTLVLGLAIGLVSAASMVFAGASENLGVPTQGYTDAKNSGGSGIVGSSHDMSDVAAGTNGAATMTGYNALTSGSAITGGITGNTDIQRRICVYCHHPHNAHAATGNTGGRTGTDAAIGSYSPLWNRTTTGVDSNGQAFEGYNNGIMMAGSTASDTQHALNAASRGGNGNTGTAISGVSLLCMSCHDGVTAMNAYSQGTGSSDGAGDNDPSSDLGAVATRTSAFKGDMNNHHPMGFRYKLVAAADNEIADADATIMVPSDADIQSNNAGALTGTVTIADLLYGADETMECVTCHDVHNTANATGAERFLWRSDNNSNFCLTCHLK